MNDKCLAIKSYICKEIKDNITSLQNIRNTEVDISDYEKLGETCRKINSIASELHKLNFDLLNLTANQYRYADRHEYTTTEVPNMKLDKDQLIKTYSICSNLTKNYWYIFDTSYYDIVNEMVNNSIKEIQLTKDNFFLIIKGKIDKEIRDKENIYIEYMTERKLESMKEIDEQNLKELYFERGGQYKIMEILFNGTYQNICNDQLDKYEDRVSQA